MSGDSGNETERADEQPGSNAHQSRWDSDKLTQVLQSKYPNLVMYNGSTDLEHITKFYEGFRELIGKPISFSENVKSDFVFAFLRLDRSRRLREAKDKDKKLEEEFLETETLEGLSVRYNICVTFIMDVIDEVIADKERAFEYLLSNRAGVDVYLKRLQYGFQMLAVVQDFCNKCDSYPDLYQESLQTIALEARREQVMEKWGILEIIHEEYDNLAASMHKMAANNLINMMLDKKNKLRDSTHLQLQHS
ncbi:hypothetical protein C6P41_001498 [Kluyveromyces marxianus]|nr:hypothetical protein C6P41_001498 [Kluyveromyces marxianus]